MTAAPAPARTGARPPAPGRPYLIPVPDSLPPFDDERSARDRLRGLISRQQLTRTAPRLRQVVQDPRVPGWSREADIGIRGTRSAALPPAEQVARVLTKGLAEVLSGRRPLAQLRQHCAAEVFAGLERLPHQRVPAAVGSVRVCEPADGVAEVAATIRAAGRCRAIAFRLEGVDGRWRITALQTG